MVKELLWDKEWRKKARELYELLEGRPTKITWSSILAEECRDVAFRLKEPFATMEEWHDVLDYKEIPYPIKLHDPNPEKEKSWKKYPDTHNQFEKRRRTNMKMKDRGRGTSVRIAIKENTPIPQLRMGIKDAIEQKLDGKITSFLSDLVEEDDT